MPGRATRFERTIEWLDHLRSGATISLGLLLVAIVGGIDYATGRELSFSIFYLFPIMLVAWCSGARSGTLLSVVSALVWGVVDLRGPGEYSQAWIPVWNAGARLGIFLIIATLLSKLRASLRDERREGRIDALTRLANRRHFFEVAQVELERSRRYHRTLSVAYLDIDNFKAVNDGLGHAAGDRLLQSVAGGLRKCTRGVDTVARLGGDEFALLMPETDSEGATAVLERIHSSLRAMVSQQEWPVTFSFGAVTLATPPRSVDELLWAADRVMYAAKRGGKDQIRHKLLGAPRQSAPAGAGRGLAR